MNSLNFIKRSILAVTRRKGKSLILFIIFAAIANLVLSGLAIQHATEYAGVLARQKLGGQLTLRYDTQSAMQKARTAGEQRPRVQSQPITEDMAKLIATNKNILGFNYIVNANGVADGFNAVTSNDDTQQSNNSNGGQQGRFTTNSQNSNYVMPDVTVTGTSSTGLVDTFKNGESKITSGRGIAPEDAGKSVAVVEKNLAEQNSLKLGDKIKVKSSRSDDEATFSIVGIYETTTSATTSNQGGGGFSFTEPYNRIFTDYKSAIPLKSVKSDTGIEEGGIDSAVFFVNDPNNIEKVKTDSKALNIDWSKFILDSNDAAFQQMVGPINNVASFSITVVYIVAAAGALILTLILLLSIKERLYETGVLLSMGEGKLKIIGQYVIEALLIAILAFGISAFSGRFIAQGVGNMLLDREIKADQTQSITGNGYGSGRGNQYFSRGQNSSPIDSMKIDITSSELEKLALAGLLILLVGTIIPAASVMRYKPKAILTKA